MDINWPLLYFAIVYSIYATPRADFVMYYSILTAVAFSSSSFGHLLAEQSVVSASAVGTFFNLLFALLCGFSPTKKELSGLTFVSFLSFPFEAMVNGEFHAYPDVLVTSAQIVLANSLDTCDSAYAPAYDAPPIIIDCPLNCGWKCVQEKLKYCVMWGIIFRSLVLAAQLTKLVGTCMQFIRRNIDNCMKCLRPQDNVQDTKQSLLPG